MSGGKNESDSDFGDEKLFICSTKQKRAEAEALVRLHGYSVKKACDIVCLSVEDYRKSKPVPQSRIEHLPTPEQIQEMCETLLAMRRLNEFRRPPGKLFPFD